MTLYNVSPYISWKGTSTNSITPSYSSPDATVSGPPFKPNPIRQWRKQLLPTANGDSFNRRAGVGMPMDLPGGATYLGNVSSNTQCLLNVAAPPAPVPASATPAAGLKENIDRYDNINCNPSSNDCYYDASNCRMARITGPRRICPSTTLLSKKYYTNSKAYLRSRCLLYEQKLTALPMDNVTYLDADGQLLYPNATDTVRRTQNCQGMSCPSSVACQTIYKPNNREFAKQGGVDSSDRITRLKLNTINKNAASYKAIFGSSASRYLGMASTPYFTKTKYQPCVNHYLSGQKTLCVVNPA